MRPDGSLTEKDAVIGVLVAAVCADGRRLREEVVAGAHVVQALAGFSVTRTEVLTRLEWMGGMLEKLGEAAFLDLCAAALPAARRPAALTAAGAVVGADGNVRPEERAFLVRLAARLGRDGAQIG